MMKKRMRSLQEEKCLNIDCHAMKLKLTTSLPIILAMNLICFTNLFQQENVKTGEVRFEHNEKDRQVKIYMNDKLFTVYHYHDTLRKPIFYPVSSPDGIIVTRGYPIEPRPFERTDHPHQTGCWFNFGDVNGLDFWNNSFAIPKERLYKYGKIVCSQLIINMSKEKVQGFIDVRLNWVGNDDRPILTELTRFIFTAAENRWMMDRITTLIAENEDVLFGDNKEGLFALRVARPFELPSDKPTLLTDEYAKSTNVPIINNNGVNGNFSGSNGLEGKEVWGTQNKWISLSAFTGGDSISIVIFDHPKNFGFPSCWHARDYGLFSVNNLGRKAYNNEFEPIEMKLAKGDSCTFRHRLVVNSDGFLPRQKIEDIFSEFSEKYP